MNQQSREQDQSIVSQLGNAFVIGMLGTILESLPVQLEVAFCLVDVWTWIAIVWTQSFVHSSVSSC